MAEHRFYAGDGLQGAAAGAELTLVGDVAHRVSRVLRMRPGERVALFGTGREFEGELIETAGRVLVRLLQEMPPEPEQPRLTLYQALIRPNRMDWLIEKVTEVGVSAVIPIISEHAAVRASEIGKERLARWRRIAVEAAEQCGRRDVPSLASPISYAVALETAPGCKVFAWEGLRTAGTPASVLVRGATGREVSLFIGPEGGWSEAEVEQARSTGALLLGLGPNVLRAETAALVATALLRLT